MPWHHPTNSALVIERPNGLVQQPIDLNAPGAHILLRNLIAHLARVTPSQAVWYIVPDVTEAARERGADAGSGAGT